MSDELLPVKTSYGAYSFNGEIYFPASLLASFKLNGFPKSRAGVYKLADREGWPRINVPGKGAKDGVLCFKVPPALLNKIVVNDLYITEEIVNEAVYKNSITPDRAVSDIKAGYKIDDAVYIEHYTEAKAAAGHGQVTPTDCMVVNVAVNTSDWRNYVGINPRYVKVISVYGDSMKPTLQHGDQVLIDTACHTFIDDGIYAIQQGDYLRVKRIKLRLDGSIEVKSDNNHEFKAEIYMPDEAADFVIVGRVLPFKFGKIDL